MILEDYLKYNSVAYPGKKAVVFNDNAFSYRELYERVMARMDSLLKQGVHERMVFCFKNSQDIGFLETYFALHLIGAVAVPLEKDISEEKFQQLREKYELFIPPTSVADILFTTGTTGLSKGVMVSHETIIAEAENLIQGQGFCHETVFVICGPLNHIGSLSKIYPVILKGGTIILLEGMRNLDAFFDALNYPSRKLASFLVPASIRILLLLAKKRLMDYADKIDFIETGAAPMPHSDKIELCKLLPATRLYNTYASTETGIISTYNFNDGVCKPSCLGNPMINSSFFITEEGRVACKGKTIMVGYAGDEELTNSVLKEDTIFTSDQGEIDSEGMLHLLGRKDDIINVGGYKVSPSEIEDIALAHPLINDCICISEPSQITGEALKLLYVSKGNVTIKEKEIALFLKQKLEHYKIPTKYEHVSHIIRTYNGKIDRKAYRENK